MASRRKMLSEILNYCGFIGNESVSQPQCSGQLGRGALILHGLYSVPELFWVCTTGCKCKKLCLAFLTACVYWFLTSLKSCISRGLFDANAECHRMFLCWSRVDRFGVTQGLHLFLVQHFLKGACLFKMVRKALLKNNQASSTGGIRSMSFQDTPARSIRKACSLKCFRERLTVMR